MFLQNLILLHIAKGLVAYCRVYIQFSKTVDDLAVILDIIESGQNFGILPETLKELMNRSHQIKLGLIDQAEPLYLAANSISVLAYSLMENDPKKTERCLTIVMAEISIALKLNV